MTDWRQLQLDALGSSGEVQHACQLIERVLRVALVCLPACLDLLGFLVGVFGIGEADVELGEIVSWVDRLDDVFAAVDLARGRAAGVLINFEVENPDEIYERLRVANVPVLRTLRAAEDTRKIPIICISMEADPAQAIAAGADYYLEKPVDIEKLREVADRALAHLDGGEG